MTAMKNDFKFKGDAFESRFRLQAKLVAQAPLHIGTGKSRTEKREKPRENVQANESGEETVKVDEIARDLQGLPFIPGSSLRGVVRQYLLHIFQPFNNGLAKNPDYETGDSSIVGEDRQKIKFRDLKQEQQRIYVKDYASLLEQLFGTPFSESKVEFWDAPLLNRIAAPSHLAAKGWDNDRQSYVVRSVAIDPQTGAAETNKLYSFDVAPPGLQFEVNIAGQNLSKTELGFLLFGLDGFNSTIFPLTLGAMCGRGFGRMKFKLQAIYRLTKDDLQKWAKEAVNTGQAGYNLPPTFLSADKDGLIEEFKKAFFARMGGNS